MNEGGKERQKNERKRLRSGEMERKRRDTSAFGHQCREEKNDRRQTQQERKKATRQSLQRTSKANVLY